MILLFLIGWLIDKISTRKYEKERAAKLAPLINQQSLKDKYASGYKVHMDIPYRGKYNDIY